MLTQKDRKYMKNIRNKNDLFYFSFFSFFATFRYGTLDVPYVLFRFLLHVCALNMEVAIFNFIFLFSLYSES